MMGLHTFIGKAPTKAHYFKARKINVEKLSAEWSIPTGQRPVSRQLRVIITLC